MQKREKGITLVALVMIIIILLILVGIAVLALTNQGIFSQAQKAKNLTEEKTAEEKSKLTNYEEQINAIIGGTSEGKQTLASKVQPGEYVTYTPDPADTAEILDELKTYSGNTSSKFNTTDTLRQETNLKWRVLDVVDGKVRLISEVPTTSIVCFEGYNGYNNVVYLLDKTCRTLYSNSKYAEKVQNLKIEDIQKYMVITDYSTIYSEYGKTFSPSYKYYPSILEQEEGQILNESTGTLGLSETANIPINQMKIEQAKTWTLKNTLWAKGMNESDFTNSIYYNLFMESMCNLDCPVYLLSSRGIDADSNYASFCMYYVCDYRKEGYEFPEVYADYLCYSGDDSGEDSYRIGGGFRPVVTLNVNVLVKSGNGTLESAYEIGL